jgi:subtilase family serine protease
MAEVEAPVGPAAEPDPTSIMPEYQAPEVAEQADPGFVPQKPDNIPQATWNKFSLKTRQAVAVNAVPPPEEPKPSLLTRLFSTKPDTGAVNNHKISQELVMGEGKGLDGPFKPHFRISARAPIPGVLGKIEHEVACLFFHKHTLSAFAPETVGHLYQFPSNLTGTGITIGLIELGGGYDVAQLNAYRPGLGNRCRAISIDGVTNSPGQSDADGEVQLDIEVAGALATGATLNVYFAQNTGASFAKAVQVASTQCQVISISWGAPEDQWAQEDRQAMDAALMGAVNAGVPVFVACGDSGYTDGEVGPHVDYPASSWYSIGCGGTRLISNKSKIASETVWNDGAQGGCTGGGISQYYGLPGFQSSLSYTEIGKGSKPLLMRGLPDVAGVGDPVTGYIVSVNGVQMVIGGSSAVSPMWAGLFALLLEYRNTTKKPAPKFLETIYKVNRVQKLTRDITSGNNGYYEAEPGWDATTGLGSPNGVALADYFHNN